MLGGEYNGVMTVQPAYGGGYVPDSWPLIGTWAKAQDAAGAAVTATGLPDMASEEERERLERERLAAAEQEKNLRNVTYVLGGVIALGLVLAVASRR